MSHSPPDEPRSSESSASFTSIPQADSPGDVDTQYLQSAQARYARWTQEEQASASAGLPPGAALPASTSQAFTAAAIARSKEPASKTQSLASNSTEESDGTASHEYPPSSSSGSGSGSSNSGPTTRPQRTSRLSGQADPSQLSGSPSSRSSLSDARTGNGRPGARPRPASGAAGSSYNRPMSTGNTRPEHNKRSSLAGFLPAFQHNPQRSSVASATSSRAGVAPANALAQLSSGQLGGDYSRYSFGAGSYVPSANRMPNSTSSPMLSPPPGSNTQGSLSPSSSSFAAQSNVETSSIERAASPGPSVSGSTSPLITTSHGGTQAAQAAAAAAAISASPHFLRQYHHRNESSSATIPIDDQDFMLPALPYAEGRSRMASFAGDSVHSSEGYGSKHWGAMSSHSRPQSMDSTTMRSVIGGMPSRQSMADVLAQTATTDRLLWDPANEEEDDYLHHPTKEDYAIRSKKLGSLYSDGGASGYSSTKLLLSLPPGTMAEKEADDGKHYHGFWGTISRRGLINLISIVCLIGGLLALFLGWPLAVYANGVPLDYLGGFNVGGTNATGQVASIPQLPSLIDRDTPKSAYTRTGIDGADYSLVFSDEFEQDGRTFWPGDDPFWEAMDFNYYATYNLEWDDPDAIITKDGSLQITMSQQDLHNLAYRSGFLSSWNKFCFTGGYVEVSVSLPGNSHVYGFWPAVWMMGNLGRAGYGATNDGVWPYSYNDCGDTTYYGTLARQHDASGVPAAALTSGSQDYGGVLSYLPGQKLSACTCSTANIPDDHPGPAVNVGRGAPEIDILEAQVDPSGVGSASQSMSVAPFDAAYNWNNVTDLLIVNTTGTELNKYKGSITQESASAVTLLDAVSYNGVKYQSFGVEYQPGSTADSGISWTVGGAQTWRLEASAMGPNAETMIATRPISQEPMYIMINFGISTKFQGIPEYTKLTFPSTMYIDYVRVYQRTDSYNVGCDPPDYPTTAYINSHLEAYDNVNRTTWAQAGYTKPVNSRNGTC
ncbi:hypothetical protein E5Q_04597 [Mixia osmundae IAM 14324]|uniref:GH16 domain-containing protein n=1 Tax=Mixia osmundae (strain CBS 9802 / IAM 14324 / JCM 22182 / KY 12970) TaxID=764103 RepID=G7E507_MIXOS|nr:hypothetical protein E5Q_04597 [Mixia osmundae IAM 14324]